MGDTSQNKKHSSRLKYLTLSLRINRDYKSSSLGSRLIFVVRVSIHPSIHPSSIQTNKKLLMHISCVSLNRYVAMIAFLPRDLWNKSYCKIVLLGKIIFESHSFPCWSLLISTNGIEGVRVIMKINSIGLHDAHAYLHPR